MICPQTKQECQLGCQDLRDCQLQLAPYEFCAGENSQAVSIHGDGVLSIDPSVTSFSAQPIHNGWSMGLKATKKITMPDGRAMTMVFDPTEIKDVNVRPSKEVGDFNLFTSPPPPTLADIERLVDAYGKQQYELGHAIGSRASFATGAEFERAALLSAIQKLTQ